LSPPGRSPVPIVVGSSSHDVIKDPAVTARARKSKCDLRKDCKVLNILLLKEHVIEIIVGINVVVFILIG